MESLANDLNLVNDDEQAMAVITDLKKKLQKLEEKNMNLEEECDLLAMENERLRELCQKHNINPDHTGDSTKASGVFNLVNIDEGEEFLLNEGGDGLFANSIGRELKEACGAGNVLCVDYLRLSSGASDAAEDYILCGGVDKTLRLYSLITNEVLYHLELAAPILAIDSIGALVACSMMDGSHAVVDLRVKNYTDLRHGFRPIVVQNQRNHTKYAVSIKWSPDNGNYLVSASHDKTVLLYEIDKRACSDTLGDSSTTPTEDPTVNVTLKYKLSLKEIPEDVIFCYLPAGFTEEGFTMSEHSSSGKELHIIVPTRGVAYLTYISCETLKHKNISLNDQEWDTHCSFNVLHMSVSPDGKSLLVATDKDFHIIMRIGTNKRLSLLAGHMCNEYGKPKTSWDVSGKYVISNNQADHNLLIYAVNTGKIVATLSGHKGQIRGIKCHCDKRNFVTASYDHTIKEWVRSE